MISRLVLSTVLTSDFFKKLRTIRTNEALEEYYSEVLEELFDTLGLKFKRNKSTYPDYEFNTDDKLEVKSTRTNRIKLNDTIPCPDVWYLVLLTSKDKFVMCRGSQLITDEERQKLTKLKDAIKSYKLGGAISAYPRANMSLTIKQELITDEDDFES